MAPIILGLIWAAFWVICRVLWGCSSIFSWRWWNRKLVQLLWYCLCWRHQILVPNQVTVEAWKNKTRHHLNQHFIQRSGAGLSWVAFSGRNVVQGVCCLYYCEVYIYIKKFIQRSRAGWMDIFYFFLQWKEFCSYGTLVYFGVWPQGRNKNYKWAYVFIRYFVVPSAC